MFANCTHIVVSLLKASKVTMVRTDVTMPPFNVISRRSIPEIVLSSKETKNYKKVKMKGGLSWMTKYRERVRSLFNGNHSSSSATRWLSHTDINCMQYS